MRAQSTEAFKLPCFVHLGAVFERKLEKVSFIEIYVKIRSILILFIRHLPISSLKFLNSILTEFY